MTNTSNTESSSELRTRARRAVRARWKYMQIKGMVHTPLTVAAWLGLPAAVVCEYSSIAMALSAMLLTALIMNSAALMYCRRTVHRFEMQRRQDEVDLDSARALLDEELELLGREIGAVE